MSNVKHPKCKIRNLANEARERMKNNSYNSQSAYSEENNLTPVEINVLTKMKALREIGEEIVNPISQLCDKELLQKLQPNERQKYILELSNAYVSLKSKINIDLDSIKEA